MHLMSDTRLPLTSTSLARILRDYGYETHPKGMAQPLAVDLEYSSDGNTAHFDVNADAVRKGGEVPDRPIRLTFDKVPVAGTSDTSPVWRLKSVGELVPGIKSKALPRQPETRKKDAPWPD
jgi:hypothetical protein